MPLSVARVVARAATAPTAGNVTRLATLAVALHPTYPAAAKVVATRVKQGVAQAKAAAPAATSSSSSAPSTSSSSDAATSTSSYASSSQDLSLDDDDDGAELEPLEDDTEEQAPAPPDPFDDDDADDDTDDISGVGAAAPSAGMFNSLTATLAERMAQYKKWNYSAASIAYAEKSLPAAIAADKANVARQVAQGAASKNLAALRASGSLDPATGIRQSTRVIRTSASNAIMRGQSLYSPNVGYRLNMQMDGDLVLTKVSPAAPDKMIGVPIWRSGTAGKGADRAVLGFDGSFAVRNGASGPKFWSAPATHSPGAMFALRDDGNLILSGGKIASTVVYCGGVPRPMVSSGGGLLGFISDAASSISDAAQSVAKVVTNNPVWDVVATGVSFVPGVGTAISAGMAATAAVGRGETAANIALAAAKGAIPGGPVAAAAFDIAVGVAKGERLDSVALLAVRDAIPGGAAAKLAFDTGLTLATHATAPAAELAQAATSIAARAGVDPKVVANSIATFTTTRTTMNVVDGVRAGDVQAAKAALAIKNAAAAGSAAGAAALASMNAVAALRARQAKAAPAAVAALPKPAALVPTTSTALAPAKATPPATLARLLAPSPPKESFFRRILRRLHLVKAPAVSGVGAAVRRAPHGPVAVAALPPAAAAPPVVAKPAGFFRRVRTAQSNAYLRGTSALYLARAKPTVRRWRGVLRTGT